MVSEQCSALLCAFSVKTHFKFVCLDAHISVFYDFGFGAVSSVADLGLLRQGAPNSKMGALTYYLAKFVLKTAWKYKNFDPWAGGGGARVPGNPLYPPHEMCSLQLIYTGCVDKLILWHEMARASV